MGDKRGAWRIGGYVADELIGYGASAQVWRGHVGRTSQPVALKVLDLADSNAVRAARTEAALLATLDHPHLVQLLELVPDGQSVVLVLELAVGGSLADLLSRRGRLSPGEVVGVISPIAAALAYAHEQGVVHSDVAPANILFRADGSPVLTDLGVARLLGGLDPPRSTLAYVDPEVAAGGLPSPASDVFMAAATALHALTGLPPWPGTTAESVLALACAGRIDRLEERLAAVPRTVSDVIRRGLSTSSGARGTAAEFALDLRHAAPPLPIDLNAGRLRDHRIRPRERLDERSDRSGRPAAIHQTGASASASASASAAAAASIVVGAAPRSLAHRPRHAAPFLSATAPRPDPLLRLDRPEFARPGAPDRDPDPTGPGADGLDSDIPPLALTHVVRAGVRSPEPTGMPGSWLRWRSGGSPRLVVALVTVVLLVGVGLATLRWAPSWPRAATAAPVVSTAPATRPSASLSSTTSSSANRPASPTRPSATPAPPRSSGPAPAGDTQWAALLAELDRHRQTAFATDDPAPLAAVYVPGTLLRQDVAALHHVVGPGCRLIGLRTRYQGVHVSSTGARSVMLVTRASLDAASLLCPGSAARSLPAHRTVSMTVVLVPNGASYLIGGIDVSA